MALRARVISVDCADPVRWATFRARAAGYDLRWRPAERRAASGSTWRAGAGGNRFRGSAHT